VHGSGTRLPVVSLIGAHPRIQPCCRSARPGTPPGPAELIPDVSSVETKKAVTRRHLGCISSHTAPDIRMVHQ
jgi:hypothetical protein